MWRRAWRGDWCLIYSLRAISNLLKLVFLFCTQAHRHILYTSTEGIGNLKVVGFLATAPMIAPTMGMLTVVSCSVVEWSTTKKKSLIHNITPDITFVSQPNIKPLWLRSNWNLKRMTTDWRQFFLPFSIRTRNAHDRIQEVCDWRWWCANIYFKRYK